MQRPTAPSLKINKIRLSLGNHHISRLEVSQHEGRFLIESSVRKSESRCRKQVIRKSFKIILKPDLIKFHTGRLEKAIFEIIQVEHHHPSAEGRLRIADIEVKIASSRYLKLREHGHSTTQHFLQTLRQFPLLPFTDNHII